MTTIKIYTQLSSDRVIERTKAANLKIIENNFKRYAKVYKLAYGFYPTEYSLSIELNEYTGISLDQLRNWLKELGN